MVERPVSLKDIIKLVEKTRSCEMNFFIPWQVYNFLMTVTLSKWEKICVDAFGVIEKHLKKIIKESSRLIFRRFQTSGLASAAEYLPIEILHLTNHIDRQHSRSLTTWQKGRVNLLNCIAAGKLPVLSHKTTITWIT